MSILISNHNLNSYAEESPAIVRAREKLMKRLGRESAQLTDEALKRECAKMRERLLKRAPSKSGELDNKIAVFDKNKHSAKVTSRFVKNLRARLENTPKNPLLLTGRVSHP